MPKKKAADGRNLDACTDGACEVEIEAGDAISFGSQVTTEPRVDSLFVVSVDAEGPTLALSSGMTTTAYGVIEINHGLRIETVHTDGTRATIKISRIG
ncbi:hypothetical protein I2W78_00755 [Streptomyces spinoverrucosus]|uniref:hypothetical protein n=1 Tax=Streptomyces spinoverrucosus TaxID=284043 RepID=UPI0018C3C2A6|nr:hypothetical protein [Streptomyces spinoverrucosus]MBG0850429.1 hypothetical protein [Streptomyces spinoverrucosus]